MAKPTRTPGEIQGDIFDTIDGAVDKFTKGLPKSEKALADKVNAMLNDLERDGVNVKTTAANLRQVQKIRNEIEQAVLNPTYEQNVADYAKTFDKVDNLQGEYFNSVVSNYKAPPVLNQMRKNAVNEAVLNLTDSGVNPTITSELTEMINTAVNSGSPFSSLRDQINNFVLGDAAKKGAMHRYAQQISIDSLYQYSAAYNATVAGNLGLEWYMYVGGKKPTSRSFCVSLLAKKYVHKSELNEVAAGNFEPRPANLNGMIPGTTGATLAINRGGFNCRHQLYAIPSEMVPDKIRAQFDKGEAITNSATIPDAPIKNRKQAVQSLYDNKVVNFASFGKMSDESVVVISKRLDKLKKEYPKLKPYTNLGVTGAGKANARGNKDILVLNTKYFDKDYKNVTTPEKYQKAKKLELESWETSKKLTPQYFKAGTSAGRKNNKAFKQVQESAKYRVYNTSAGVLDPRQGTITHEYGHKIHDEVIGLRASKYNVTLAPYNVAVDLNNELSHLRHRAVVGGDIYNMSAYAATNNAEFFAESFTLYNYDKAKVPSYMIEFIELILKYTK